MHTILRQALRQDIPAMHRVRVAVRENRLTSSVITEAHYLPAIEATGRGWVIETGGKIVGFAVGNARTGNIWALFVDPDYEGCGYGRRLHEAMIHWLFSCKLKRLYLSTGPDTRAQQFYEMAGWQCKGLKDGEMHFELFNPHEDESPSAELP